jgi:hypothetical protein
MNSEKIKNISHENYIRNRFARFCRKASQDGENPHIGIFWFLPPDNQIVGRKKELAKIKWPAISAGEAIDIEISHDKAWEEISKKHELLEEYYEIPRGRVLFLPVTSTFRIISSTEIINNKQLTREILKFFKIQTFKFELIKDLHYEDPKTMPDLFS